jgi:hypothetical protein
MNSIASSCYGFDINVVIRGTVITYCEQALGVFTVMVNRALNVDRNLVWLVAHRVHLRDTVDARFRRWAGWKWWCGFGGHSGERGDGWLGGWSVMSGAHIMESEECGQECDLQPFAVRDVKPVSFNRLRIAQNWGKQQKDVPIEIVIQDLNGGLRSRLDLLRDGDEDCWIWFPDKITRLPLPLECVSESSGQDETKTDESTRMVPSLTLPS